jgi:DedD protein
MSDQGYREIQLTGKQLVFFFMASVVLAVAIFLLGVSVGRGVRGAQPAVEPTASAETLEDAPAAMPPPTELRPTDQRYHTELQGQRDGAPPVAAASETKPVAAPAAPPAAPAATPQAPAPAPVSAPAGEAIYIQTGAFSTRANANRQITELKSKGHAAVIVPTSGGSPFRVRLGPFTNRTEVDRLRARLKAEGFDSSVSP